MALSHRVCADNGWLLSQVRFYTGYPTIAHDPFWGAYWQKRLLALTRQGIHMFKRELRYREEVVRLADRSTITVTVGKEKGVDVRLALDVVRLALDDKYDVAIIFSQDQDLSEAAAEVRAISKRTQRWIKVACAFPVGPRTQNRRGIDRTDWLPIDQAVYDACLDARDYRPSRT